MLILLVASGGVLKLAGAIISILFLLLFLFTYKNDLRKLYIENETLKEKQRNNPIKILYLRNFSHDGLKMNNTFSTFFLNFKVTAKGGSYETDLSLKLGKIGHFISIGLPSQEGDIGADREIIDDENWKETVLLRMKTASMIIFRPGLSQGVLWEFEQIVKAGYLHKTIFCMYNKEDKKKTYKNFAFAAADLLSLPKFSYWNNFIYFTTDNQSKKASYIEEMPVYSSLVRQSALVNGST